MRKIIYVFFLPDIKKKGLMSLLASFSAFLFLTIVFLSTSCIPTFSRGLSESSDVNTVFYPRSWNNKAHLGTSSFLLMREHRLTGTVVDLNGDPLIGVTIRIKGTNQGTITGESGKFTLEVPENATIVVSFVGYQTQEIEVGSDTHVSIQLESSAKRLEDLVVVGYGTQKKASVVGSITDVSGKDIKETTGNTSDIREALVGQVNGLVGLTMSGEPGGVLTGESATNLFIRGQTTWNGSQPLVLVDGVKRNMNNIDINSVESISVLKDASATAVYGVEGANGVILITTKRGQAGKTQFHVNYVATGKMLSKQPNILDAYDAKRLRDEIIEREGVLDETSWGDYLPFPIVKRYQKPQSPLYSRVYTNVDWQEQMYKTMGFSHKVNLTASGGSDLVQFFGSLAYRHDGDMFKDFDNGKGYDPNYNYDRFNFRSNIDFEPTKTTKLSLNLSGFYSQKNTNWNNEGSSSRADQWMWSATYNLAPDLFKAKYPNGRWGAYQEGGNNTVNPAAVVYNIGIRETRQTNINSDFTIDQDLDFITKGLSARVMLAVDNYIRSEGGIYDVQNSVRPAESRTNVPYIQYYPENFIGPNQDSTEYTQLLPVSDEEYDWVMQPWSTRSEAINAANWVNHIPVRRRLTYQGQMNYNRTFTELHNVTAMGVFKREQYAVGSEFRHFREDWAFRATYNYDLRYFFEFNGAYNGSEQFGPGFRFAFFPSLAVGWNVANEPYFNVDWIDNLKFRFSRGEVGNDNVAGGRWLYRNSYSRGGAANLGTSISASSPYTIYRISTLGNPDIHWETAVKSDFGIDFSVLNQLFTLTFDYFTEDRTDILLAGNARAIPPFFGAVPPAANLGHVKSKGEELEIKFNKRLGNYFSIFVDVSLAHNQNEVLFRDDPQLEHDYKKAAGFPIGQQRHEVGTSIFQNWDEVYASVPTESNDLQKLPGYYDLMDMNGDGIIKSSDDVVPIGYSKTPQNSGTLTLGATYKGLNFKVQLYGANNANRYINWGFWNYFTDIVHGENANEFWYPENATNKPLPRWKTQASTVGDLYMYDASYLRLRTIEVGYSFINSTFVHNLGIDNFRIFLNANNLFYWSELPDDRQTTYSGGSATQGSYPTLKEIHLGFDLTF